MAFRVLDASAFYAGVPFASRAECGTTRLVYDEVAHIKSSHGAIDALLESGRLRVAEPDASSTRAAEQAAAATGDLPRLSPQDVSVLALAIETGGELVTDDYAVSNVAHSLGIAVHPVMTRGIRDAGRWFHYCPGCGEGRPPGRECPACGTQLRRRLVR